MGYPAENVFQPIKLSHTDSGKNNLKSDPFACEVPDLFYKAVTIFLVVIWLYHILLTALIIAQQRTVVKGLLALLTS